MLKLYAMTINGEEYNALFVDHMEASLFLDEATREGDDIVINKISDVTRGDVEDMFGEYYLDELFGSISK